jgi:hypothetical protein
VTVFVGVDPFTVTVDPMLDTVDVLLLLMLTMVAPAVDLAGGLLPLTLGGGGGLEEGGPGL